MTCGTGGADGGWGLCVRRAELGALGVFGVFEDVLAILLPQR